jgi:hypothetical protein
VEVTAYGIKQWEDPVKQKDGRWTKVTREGYYAGFIKVPKEKPNP